MQHKTSFAIFAAAAIFAALPAFGDTLSLTGLPPDMYDGFYVGPVTGSFNGGPEQLLFCDDFTDTASVPSMFSVLTSTIPSLTNAKFAQPGPPTTAQLNAYEEEVLLAQQMMLPANASDTGAIQFAMWDITDPSAPSPSGAASWVAWAESQNLAAGNYSGVTIFTPAWNGQSQEFFSIASTPEPKTTYVLIGFALIGLVVWRRRQRIPARE